MDDKVMVGLDVGSSKVCAIVGRLDESNKLVIMGLGMADTNQGVEKGVVRNINKTTEAIQRAINTASDQSNVLVGEVITNISSQNISTQELPGSLVLEKGDQEIQYKDTEKLSSNMLMSRLQAGNQMLHVIPQEYIVDNGMWPPVYNPVGMGGMKLEANFLAITTPTLPIENLEKSIKDLPGKVELKSKVLSSLAASIATITTEEKEAGVALVDIGAGTTDIVIYHKNIVRFVCTLPFGGNNITDDIVQGCNVLKDQAELLKVNHGAAISYDVPDYEVVTVPGIGNRTSKEVSVKNISIIIEERLKEIAAMVWASISKANLTNKLSAGIILTGGTAQLPDIDVLFAHATKKDVRIGHPNIGLAKSNLMEVNNPAYATAIGLLWKGFKSYDSRKDDILKSKEGKTKYVAAGVSSMFDKPIEKNFWKKSVDLVKGILKEDIGKLDDKI